RILRALCRHWRADEAGRDRVDIDPQRREFERQRPGEGQETALGGAICCAARAWDRLVHRGDVDDLAAARGLSPTDEFAAAEKRAVKIGVDYLVEFLGRHLGHAGPAAAYAGIVYQDVGGAEFAGYRLEQARDAFFVPNVGLPHDRSS